MIPNIPVMFGIQDLLIEKSGSKLKPVTNLFPPDALQIAP